MTNSSIFFGAKNSSNKDWRGNTTINFQIFACYVYNCRVFSSSYMSTLFLHPEPTPPFHFSTCPKNPASQSKPFFCHHDIIPSDITTGLSETPMVTAWSSLVFLFFLRVKEFKLIRETGRGGGDCHLLIICFSSPRPFLWNERTK